MNTAHKKNITRAGLSLAEMLAALVIGSMILVAMVTIHARAEHAAAAIRENLDSGKVPYEIIQRIAEDLDGINPTTGNTKITFESKADTEGYSTARLEILKTILDKSNKAQTFERIVWQSSVDFDSFTDGLVLYRSYSGMVMEDKILDETKEDWERELFVPVCQEVTFFELHIPQGDTVQNKWTSDTLPSVIVVTVSLAEPEEQLDGTWAVPDERKVSRTISVNKTREIKFTLPEKNEPEDEEPNIPNILNAPNAPNLPNIPDA